jgi:uncharacterized integral membrane protein (TIGR00697 family)
MSGQGSDSETLPTPRLALVALFVTALVASQVTASKILGFASPVALPLTGTLLVMPGAALAYAVTYTATDCYSELYGRAAATQLVLVGFAMNFVLLALVFSTLAAPAAPFVEDPGVYDRVLGASANVVAGSLLAYLVSQNWDVYVFHRIREATDGDRLWLRNLASTASSQAIDTVLFVTVAFGLAPLALAGDPETLSAIGGLIVGQYALKLLIAVVDTPLVYLIVGAVRDGGTASGTVAGR